MNHHINNKYVATGISSYNDSFWKAMRGSDKAYGDLIEGKHSLTNTYLLPESTASKYSAALWIWIFCTMMLSGVFPGFLFAAIG